MRTEKREDKKLKTKSKLSNRRILAIFLSLALILALGAACGQAKNDVPTTVGEIVDIAALNGPTGMGMVKLMDLTDKYSVTTYQAPTDITAKLISGEVDVAALPSNMAAVLYNKTQGEIVAISPIALGVLYILGNDVELTSISDLEGKTIYASGQGGTPEYVLQKVLETAGLNPEKDVTVKWLANHADVNQKLLSEEGTIAMVPEPFVSTALTAGNGAVTEIFDMNAEWQNATGQELPMGVLVARKDFVTERQADLEVLLADYEDSVTFVNGDADEAAAFIVEKGFIAREEIAKSAIERCKIVLYAGKNANKGEDILKTFNETLYEMEPASVGGTLPDDELYYGKTQ